MNNLVFLLFMVQIVHVQSSNDVCLKAFKRKLCFKLSVQKYNYCLSEQIRVFEENDKFCVTNTICVPKTSNCLGIYFNTFKLRKCKLKLKKIKFSLFVWLKLLWVFDTSLKCQDQKSNLVAFISSLYGVDKQKLVY